MLYVTLIINCIIVYLTCSRWGCTCRLPCFDCLLVVLFRWWGWLIIRHQLYHEGGLCLVYFDPSTVLASSYSLSSSLLYLFIVVVFFDHGHPCFRNFQIQYPCCCCYCGEVRTRQNNGTMGGLKCTNHSQPLWYKWHCVISQTHRLKMNKMSNKNLFLNIIYGTMLYDNWGHVSVL